MPEVIRSQYLKVQVPTKQRSSPSISRAPWLMNSVYVVGYANEQCVCGWICMELGLEQQMFAPYSDTIIMSNAIVHPSEAI